MQMSLLRVAASSCRPAVAAAAGCSFIRERHSPLPAVRGRTTFNRPEKLLASRLTTRASADDKSNAPKEGAPNVDSASPKGFGAPAKNATSKRRERPEEPLLKTDATSDAAKTEALVLLVLASLFSLIIFEGVLLAISGFLPEAIDNWVTNTLYPTYTGQLGIFFAGSAGYGLLKYLGIGIPQNKGN